jgi:LmbE family N-acetylglucosaminyl deacetylase
VNVDLPVPERVLAVGAHADDVEFGCGATLAKWAAAGASVHLCVLTDGSKGTWDAEADPAAVARIRRQEQDAAARELGAAAVTYLDFVDGELVAGRGERAAVCAVIRRARADVVMGHDPWKRYRLHPDHRAGGTLLIDGLVAARDPLFFPEQGLAPHRPRRLLLFEADEVDHLERVDGYLETKVSALLTHQSQWRSTMRIDRAAPDVELQRSAFVERVHAEAIAAGEHAGIGPAEGFKLIEDL